jgi:hypothetical protein
MHDVPEIDLLDLEGNVTSLRSYRGSPVLLVFLRWLG